MKCYFILFSATFLWSFAQSKIITPHIFDPLYPYIVQIELFGQRICEGTIINEDWILTAAHCTFANYPEDITIRYTYTGFKWGSCPEYVTDIIVHPNYDHLTGANNVALLELEGEIPIGSGHIPIKLAEYNSFPPEGPTGILVGQGTDPPKKIIATKMEIFANSECESLELFLEVTDEMICGGKIEGEKCPSFGGGGPLIIDNVQYGVASSPEDCELMVFTSLGYPDIRKFIEMNTGT